MEFTPRGPIFSSESDKIAPAYAFDGGRQAYEQKMSRWRESAREEALNTLDLNPEKNATEKYFASMRGEWWPRKRAQYKSRFFDNRLNNVRLSDLALLTDTKPTIDVSCKVDAYKEDADIVSKVIQAEWMKNNMDISLTLVADIAKLEGTAFWKIGAAAPGIMQVLPCGTSSVMPIQPGLQSIQQSTAVMYRTWKALSYFRNKFPYSNAGLEAEVSFTEQNFGGDTRFNRPDHIIEHVWNGLSPAMRRLVGVRSEPSTSDLRSGLYRSLELQEFYIDDPATNDSDKKVLMRHPYLSLEAHNWWYWVNPGQRLYPRKRLVVFAGRRVVYDGPSPYWHGLYPFACLRFNQLPDNFWGLSKYRDLLPLNMALNDIGAGILDMIKRALNPVAVTKASAMAPATWAEFYPDMPGAKLFMLPNGNPTTDVRYLDPPNIPAWVIQFHQYLVQEYDRLSGAMDIGGLSKKKQVPGGDTIEAMKDQMNSIARLEERYLEVFLRDAGEQSVSNVFQYYTMPQRMRLLGSDGISMQDFDFKGGSLIPDSVKKEDHWRNFPMAVLPGSLHGANKDRNKQTAIALAAKHLLPLEMLYESLDLPNPKAIFAMLIKEQEAGMQATGKAPKMTRGQKTGKAA